MLPRGKIDCGSIGGPVFLISLESEMMLSREVRFVDRVEVADSTFSVRRGLE